MKKIILNTIITCLTIIANGQPTIKLISKNIQLKSGLQFNLQIPEGYNICKAAEVEHRLRFLAKSPDGRLFATDMYNRGDNKLGRILIFENWNVTNHAFDKTTEYLTHLRNPNQVAFYSVGNQHFLYTAETGFIKRYNYHFGDTKPTDTGTVIARYPDYGLNYKYGGWHLTRSLTIHNNKLYVSVGSSCNACIETEKVRAVIIEMNMDGSEQKIFATGLRNSVALQWIDEKLWVTSMGRDQIGPDKPEDLMMPVARNIFYGWPFYFQYQNKIYVDAQFKDSIKPVGVKMPPVAPVGFKAHSAPLGFTYIKNCSDATLNNSFLVALHGSTSVWRQRGNAVVQIVNGKYREIVTGFLQGKTEDKRFGRPCDVMQWSANAFFITDDKNGVLYYLWK